MALAARRAANGGPGGDGNGRAGGEFCYFVIHAVAWALAERGAPRGLRRLSNPILVEAVSRMGRALPNIQ
jgi:hypothetical protein